MANVGNAMLSNDPIFLVVASCLFCNVGGCEFAQSSKSLFYCWLRYLTIETYTLYLPFQVRNRVILYPECVRKVSISYPNLWTKDPPLLYESLSNLINVSRLCSLTLRFSIIKNCTMDNLMYNIIDVISSMEDDVVRHCTIYLHFERGIYPWRRLRGTWSSMPWEESKLFVWLHWILQFYSVKIECSYHGLHLSEDDVVRELLVRL